MNITKNPQTKKRKVLKMKPTSAETVVSAKPALVIFSKKNKLTNGPTSFLINLVI